MSSVTSNQIIHFVNRIDHTNVGDYNCCPLNYYYDFFKEYNLMRHDIDFVKWEQISRNDVVIIGASGMLNVTQSFNTNINKLLNKCDNVVAWSIGFNTHNGQWYQGNKFESIDFNKFALITIRDYNHPSGLEWLPCPFALAPDVLKKRVIQRKIGVIEHKSLPIKGLPYAKISNAYNLDEVTEFVASSEAILTNSYHMVYLAQLMKKKTVVFNKFSTKFDRFKYVPEFVGCDNDGLGVNAIEAAVARAEIYDGTLDEAIELNRKFFLKVKDIVLQTIVNKGTSYQQIWQLTQPELFHTQNDLRKLADIEPLNSAVETAHNRITELHGHIYPFIEEKFHSVDRIIDERRKDTERRFDESNNGIETAHNRITELHGHIYPFVESQFHDISRRIDESCNSVENAHNRVDELHKHIYPFIEEKLNAVNYRIDEQRDYIDRRIDAMLFSRIKKRFREIFNNFHNG